MNRTIFLIDGFNVYHSAKHVSRDLRGAITKWLNLHSFCSSVLPLVGRGAELTSIFYFSALAKHLLHSDPDTVRRHEDYMKCLETKGIIVDLARFKEKRIKCKYCKRTNIRHEEKETDVAIAAKLFELFYTNSCDIIVMVTGDTDLSPAVRTTQLLFPEKEFFLLFHTDEDLMN